ncbi:MAG: carotenoid 1,2-hydratase, partial [Acidobacteria bacterium]|nr:carotenoid 1,2-hydratase [Acidobacteriota bacterium]
MTRRVSLLVCLCLLSAAGGWMLPQQSGLSLDYRRALAGYIFEFPRDHGAHPDFKLEWWYYTGHLESETGRRFGYELVFFRSGTDRDYANPSRWKIRNLYMAHFAVTDIASRRFRYFEKLNRSGPGIAGAETASLRVWNENWSARLQDGAMRLRAAAGGVELALELRPQKPPVIHGRDGISRKGAGPGQASHYYSLTRLKSQGTVTVDGRVFQVMGQSWMDHEFGTNQLAPEQVGWDWFSLQLESGEELMLYRLRHRDGSIDPHSSGTMVLSTGKTVHL